MNEARCRRLSENALKTFDLDLSDLIVLTEAASKYYMLTPLIAGLAGAKRVYAITRDSRYGKAKDICQEIMTLAKRWGVENQIEILLSREDARIGLADIVTNLGFVRPLDAAFLQRLKPTAVIPLMFETWEYRAQDLDLGECQRLGIPVLGTNEHHPDLQIFHYVGHLVIKLLFELDIEVYRSKVIVVGGGKFGKATLESLESAGAEVLQIYVEKGESLADEQYRKILAACDAIAIVEHQSKEKIIGQEGQITAQKLKSLNPGIVLVHIAGNLEQSDIESAGIPFKPNRLASVGYMSVATDYLGARPLIDLHTAGLKVGEIMARIPLETRNNYIEMLTKERVNCLAQTFH